MLGRVLFRDWTHVPMPYKPDRKWVFSLMIFLVIRLISESFESLNNKFRHSTIPTNFHNLYRSVCVRFWTVQYYYLSQQDIQCRLEVDNWKNMLKVIRFWILKTAKTAHFLNGNRQFLFGRITAFGSPLKLVVLVLCSLDRKMMLRLKILI